VRLKVALGLCLTLALIGAVGDAAAQTSLGDLLGRTATPEGQPKTLLEEMFLWGYLENSYVVNLGQASPHNVNDLRFYDHDADYSWNALELSLKKDASERYPWGFGVVTTAGMDSQKNHSLGIFRDLSDGAPYYRNTVKYDLVEAYGTALLPLGNGLTVKAGKWPTLIGYEVYENPKNLNFSRDFLYTLGTPYTHTGLLVTYPFAKWISATLGFTMGWDNSDNPNGYLKATGQVAFTPSDKFSITTAFHVGPEQLRSQMHDQVNQRWIVDTTILYTGIDKVTLAANFDFAGEQNDPVLVALGTRKSNTSSWSGIAVYGAYDWTKSLRTVLRLEYFADPQAVRNGITAPGHNVNFYGITPTLEYKIWRGLVGKLEYRHDQASRNAFSLEDFSTKPISRSQDTLSIALQYSFF
jgi:Putative beta-barrel porin-2, OmpL-like. bbp2